MSEYKKPYFILLSAFADAIDYMEKGANGAAKLVLIEAMQNAEEAYVSYGETEE